MAYHWRWHSLRTLGMILNISADEVIKDKKCNIDHTAMLEYVKELNNDIKEAITGIEGGD